MAENPVAIDERFLTRPAFAMELCRSKVREMAEITRKSMGLALEVLMEYDDLDEPITVQEQVLPPTPVRTGFTVVEWGGEEYKAGLLQYLLK